MKLGNNPLQILMLQSVFRNDIVVKKMQFCPIIQCNFAPLFNLEMEIHKEVVTSYYPKNIINRKFVQCVLQVPSEKLMCMLK